MDFKREKLGFVGTLTPDPQKSEGVGENNQPRLWEGRQLKQLSLPAQFLQQALEHQVANKKVAPSNLSEMRARLKAKQHDN